jgi:hypothetical protein
MPDGEGYGIIGNEIYVVIVSLASHVYPPPYNSSSCALQSILHFAPCGEGVLFNDQGMGYSIVDQQLSNPCPDH